MPIYENTLCKRTNKILPMHPKKKIDWLVVMSLSAIGMTVGMILTTMIKSCDAPPEPTTATINCTTCHTTNSRDRLAHYFKKKGSPSPEEMANAVLQTKNPRLLAAMATVETNGNPRTRKTGYKNRHDGAFQVNPSYHGRVPLSAGSQALQAERILSELTETMPIVQALNAYGGHKDKVNGEYAYNVLKELTTVPQ